MDELTANISFDCFAYMPEFYGSVSIGDGERTSGLSGFVRGSSPR